jgi:hypothetical protein
MKLNETEPYILHGFLTALLQAENVTSHTYPVRRG